MQHIISGLVISFVILAIADAKATVKPNSDVKLYTCVIQPYWVDQKYTEIKTCYRLQ